MSAHARKSFVWLWMAALLSASFGMTVEQVYCYCTGKTTISLFASADTCDSEKQAAAQTGCCQKELTPAKKSCCEKPDSKKGNCTKKTTQIIQLRTEYEVASSVLKKLDAPKTWVLTSTFSTIFSVVQKIDLPGFEQPPPPLSGRMICVRHGVFRC